jgi:hypothetical protein
VQSSSPVEVYTWEGSGAVAKGHGMSQAGHASV